MSYEVWQAVLVHTEFRLNHGWARMTCPFLNMWTSSPSQADKNLRTIWSSNSTSEDIPRRIETTPWKRYLYTHVHSSFIHIFKSWKQPKYPLTKEKVSQIWYTPIIKYYSTFKKKGREFPGGLVVKNISCMQCMGVQSPVRELRFHMPQRKSESCN